MCVLVCRWRWRDGCRPTPEFKVIYFLLFQSQTLPVKAKGAACHHGNDLQSRLPQLNLIVQLCSAIAACIHFIYFSKFLVSQLQNDGLLLFLVPDCDFESAQRSAVLLSWLSRHLNLPSRQRGCLFPMKTHQHI